MEGKGNEAEEKGMDYKQILSNCAVRKGHSTMQPLYSLRKNPRTGCCAFIRVLFFQ